MERTSLTPAGSFADDSRPSPTSATILVTDDDEMTRELVADVLRDDGYDVREAADGDEAVEAVRAHRPDLVVLDVVMPRMNGIDACRAMRELPDSDSLQILVLTAMDDEGHVRRAFDAGASDFASKPVQWSLFRQRVRFLLRSQQQQREIRLRRAQLAQAQRIARLGDWELDPAADRIVWSDEARRLLNLGGLSETAMENLGTIFGPSDGALFREAIAAARNGSSSVGIDLRSGGPESPRHIHVAIDAAWPAAPGPQRLVGTVQDITERKEAEERIRELAYHDGLTGLPNRILFSENLQAALGRALRLGKMIAVMFLDLDHFKEVNDTLGHDAGDLLIRTVGSRLRDVTRSYDGVTRSVDLADSGVARLGGDEFILAITDLNSAKDAASVAERILASLRKPVLLETGEIDVSVSIGISLYPQDGSTEEELLKKADIALYQAKSAGRNRYRFHDPALDASMTRKRALEDDLRADLERGALGLRYAPRVRLASSSVVGHQVDIVWDHRGPDTMDTRAVVALAESAAVGRALGAWTLGSACAREKPGAPPDDSLGYLAVGVSPSQLRRSAVVEDLVAATRVSGFPLERLRLEISEETAARDVAETAIVLRALKGLGVLVGLDRLTLSGSSIPEIAGLTWDFVKIDLEMFRGPRRLPDFGRWIPALVALARAIAPEVLVSGVETAEERELLTALGCDVAQGPLFREPCYDSRQTPIARGLSLPTGS